MTEIEVKLQNPYKVIIQKNLIDNAGQTMRQVLLQSKKVLIVSDSNVTPLYMLRVKKSFESAGFDTCTFSFECGEKSKNFKTYQNLITACAINQLTRNDCIVALGGGVTGDLVGFVASTYMRGIPYIQMPTTLLSAIDSSIGGKVGIDTPWGKNLVGAFYQPKAVLCDINTLKTLPEKEWQNGIGEGIKYALLQGGECLDILEKGLNENNLEKFISLSVLYKKDLCERDEKDYNERRVLNFGHTIGHAIETLSNYELSHGLSVAKGMFMILKSELNHNNLQQSDFLRIKNLFLKYNFNLDIDYKKEQLIKIIANDKKLASNGTLSYVSLKNIGCPEIKSATLLDFEESVL